jgi:hypothetical protein
VPRFTAETFASAIVAFDGSVTEPGDGCICGLRPQRAGIQRRKENQQKTGNFVHNANLSRARFAIIVPVQSFCDHHRLTFFTERKPGQTPRCGLLKGRSHIDTETLHQLERAIAPDALPAVARKCEIAISRVKYMPPRRSICPNGDRCTIAKTSGFMPISHS